MDDYKLCIEYVGNDLFYIILLYDLRHQYYLNEGGIEIT